MIGLVNLVCAAVLGFAPSPNDAGASFEGALAELERGNELANENDPKAADVLSAALETLHEFAPQLARDLDAQERRLLAQLNLARVYLVNQRDYLANEMMDEAIRLSLGADLPADRLGPKVGALYRQRVKALARQGSAQLEIECTTPCHVYVNEQTTGTRIRGLQLGTYHLWIEDSEGMREPKSEEVTLSAAGERVVVEYGPGPVDLDARASVTDEPRILPLWAEITLTTVGAALIVAGGTTLAFQGRCPGGLDPVRDALDCPRVYEARAVGGALTALGSVSLLSGGVLLSVDQVRSRGREGVQVMAGWSLRF